MQSPFVFTDDWKLLGITQLLDPSQGNLGANSSTVPPLWSVEYYQRVLFLPLVLFSPLGKAVLLDLTGSVLCDAVL